LSSKLIKGVQLKEAPAYFLDIRDLSGGLDQMCRSGGDLLQTVGWNQQEIDDLINLKVSEKVEEITQESRQAGYEKGYEKGYEEGYGKGYGEGLKKAEEEAVSLRAEAKDILGQAKNIYREQLASLHGNITALAVEIAEKILGAQLKLDQDMVLHIAAEAMQMMSNHEHYTIYANPEEAEIFKSKRHELESAVAGLPSIQIIADPGVAPGGCLVDTGQGMVEASLEARWAAMLEIVYGRVE